jgi:MtN3 and saliva related transmembrane protein
VQLDMAEGIGLIAGAIGSFAFAPQALKILRDNSAEDVSAVTYSMVCGGALLWFAYGVMKGSPAIMLWNAVAVVLAGAVLILKFRLRGR